MGHGANKHDFQLPTPVICFLVLFACFVLWALFMLLWNSPGQKYSEGGLSKDPEGLTLALATYKIFTSGLNLKEPQHGTDR